ncbi:MAG: HAD-IA family hydrolase [Gemmatimonadaceae bacterium]
MTGLTLTCQAVLFDLDGVLVDSRAVVERTWQHWAAHRGVDGADLGRRAHGRRTIETVREFAPHLDAASEARWLETLEVRDVDGVVALPGAAAMYNAIADSRRAVVTSGGRALAANRLHAVGLALPSVLVVAEDVAHGKPAPDGYLIGASRLGIAPSLCLVIEDAPPGIAAAKAAGATVLAVATTFPAADLTAADMTVASLAAVRVSVAADAIHVEVMR